MPGPAPRHPNQRRRQNRAIPFLELPAEGRKGKAPRWPLSKLTEDTGPVHKLELELWRELWKLPQAVAWETLGYLREVAAYVRWEIRGELGELAAAQEARLRSDRLGLTPKAAKSLGWVIVDTETTSGKDVTREATLNVSDIRSRIASRRAAG